LIVEEAFRPVNKWKKAFFGCFHYSC
jgi:hypothetical protein